VAESQYGKYIVTEITPGMKQLSYEGKPKDIPPDKATRLFWLDDYVIHGAFYSESVWIWKGSDEIVEEAHTHDFDEVISFLGTNFEDPHDLCGEIELWLGDEKHILTRSGMVFVPKGLKHCPLIIRRVDRPIFHFTAGPAAQAHLQK
jgi:hypothetical protein